MTIISKSAALLSLTSSVIDMHKVAKVKAQKAKDIASANAINSDSIGSQKTDYFSFKDAGIKNFASQNNYFIGLKETCAKIGGYVKGFIGAGVRYIPNFILSAIAFAAKSKQTSTTKFGDKFANIAAIALGVIEGCNFIKNSTNIGQKTDYLKY